MNEELLIQKHGGYRNLKSFQLARLIFDLTVRFCDRFIDKRSRTHDQMIQAARSGVQNIAEGSLASGTSKKTELKLTNVARASLGELLLDYEDFLRQRQLTRWDRTHPLRNELIELRCATSNQFVLWVKQTEQRTKENLAGIAANGIIALITVTCALLHRQLKAQEDSFLKDGGFTERLHRLRTKYKK